MATHRSRILRYTSLTTVSPRLLRRTVSKASATWSRLDETYIPSKWEMSVYDKQYATVEFSWASINQELPESTFSLSGMPVPKGTIIVNHKPGAEPIIEGKVQ